MERAAGGRLLESVDARREVGEGELPLGVRLPAPDLLAGGVEQQERGAGERVPGRVLLGDLDAARLGGRYLGAGGRR